jgi:hypothetical protein
MKKAKSYGNRKRSKGGSMQNLEVATEAMQVLRTVGNQEAFYFYEAIGKPTGEVARDLSDFLDKVKSIKSESLAFHVQRRDFQNWVQKILGDSELAKELGEISVSNSGDIRMKIQETVENRIRELKASPTALMVSENSAILLPSS